MRKQSGFSLIELLVVIVILGALMAITVPNYLTYIPKSRLKTAARDLYSELQLAKMAAIKVNGDCTVTYATSPDRYTIEYTLGGGGATQTKTVNLADYKSGVKFDGPGTETFDSPTINFNSRGLRDAPAGNAYAYLSNATNTGYYRVGPLISGVVQL
ncbi:GspH/FimT family pseudopilin, partial [Thermodesulfobacteriota bacterium]